jgi:hypothetical protein
MGKITLIFAGLKASTKNVNLEARIKAIRTSMKIRGARYLMSIEEIALYMAYRSRS